MTFTSQQTAALRAKLRRRHVKTRMLNGSQLAFLEGWHVIAEANRIFGYDCWDRRTQAPRCVWSAQSSDGQTAVIYTTTVRITVRAGGSAVMRNGIGTGFGRAAAAEIAHEIAVKAAETDATKRALATFGNPFGLPLYDKLQKSVTGARRAPIRKVGIAVPPRAARPTFALHTSDGKSRTFVQERVWLAAAHDAVSKVPTLAELYAFWQANKFELKQIRLSPLITPDLVEAFIDAMKRRARALGRAAPAELTRPTRPPSETLLIPKETRIRNKAHLAFVRSLPCVICGRQPSHAHHIKFAQQGALGMKVSDEYTVPLCFLDHDALHNAGNERAWWEARKVDPLPIAADLWASTRRSGAHEGQIPDAASLDHVEDHVSDPSLPSQAPGAHP